MGYPTLTNMLHTLNRSVVLFINAKFIVLIMHTVLDLVFKLQVMHPCDN